MRMKGKAWAVARQCRNKSLLCQEYARSAADAGEEWEWYRRAFVSLALHLERDREKFAAMPPDALLDVPTVLMK
jgi:hypothetical protein